MSENICTQEGFLNQLKFHVDKLYYDLMVKYIDEFVNSKLKRLEFVSIYALNVPEGVLDRFASLIENNIDLNNVANHQRNEINSKVKNISYFIRQIPNVVNRCKEKINLLDELLDIAISTKIIVDEQTCGWHVNDFLRNFWSKREKFADSLKLLDDPVYQFDKFMKPDFNWDGIRKQILLSGPPRIGKSPPVIFQIMFYLSVNCSCLIGSDSGGLIDEWKFKLNSIFDEFVNYLKNLEQKYIKKWIPRFQKILYYTGKKYGDMGLNIEDENELDNALNGSSEPRVGLFLRTEAQIKQLRKKIGENAVLALLFDECEKFLSFIKMVPTGETEYQDYIRKAKVFVEILKMMEIPNIKNFTAFGGTITPIMFNDGKFKISDVVLKRTTQNYCGFTDYNHKHIGEEDEWVTAMETIVFQPKPKRKIGDGIKEMTIVWPFKHRKFRKKTDMEKLQADLAHDLCREHDSDSFVYSAKIKGKLLTILVVEAKKRDIFCRSFPTEPIYLETDGRKEIYTTLNSTNKQIHSFPSSWSPSKCVTWIEDNKQRFAMEQTMVIHYDTIKSGYDISSIKHLLHPIHSIFCVPKEMDSGDKRQGMSRVSHTLIDDKLYPTIWCPHNVWEDVFLDYKITEHIYDLIEKWQEQIKNGEIEDELLMKKLRYYDFKEEGLPDTFMKSLRKWQSELIYRSETLNINDVRKRIQDYDRSIDALINLNPNNEKDKKRKRDIDNGDDEYYELNGRLRVDKTIVPDSPVGCKRREKKNLIQHPGRSNISF